MATAVTGAVLALGLVAPVLMMQGRVGGVESRPTGLRRGLKLTQGLPDRAECLEGCGDLCELVGDVVAECHEVGCWSQYPGVGVGGVFGVWLC